MSDNMGEEGEETPLLPRHGGGEKGAPQKADKLIHPDELKSSSDNQRDKLWHTVIDLPEKTVKEIKAAVNGFSVEDERRSWKVGGSDNVVEGPLEVVGSHNVELGDERGSLVVNAEDDCEAPRWLALAAGGVPMVGHHHHHHYPHHLHPHHHLLKKVALTFLLCYVPYLAMVLVFTAIVIPILHWTR